MDPDQSERILNMFLNKTSTDTDIKVFIKNTSTSKEIPCHKCFVSTYGPVFSQQTDIMEAGGEHNEPSAPTSPQTSSLTLYKRSRTENAKDVKKLNMRAVYHLTIDEDADYEPLINVIKFAYSGVIDMECDAETVVRMRRIATYMDVFSCIKACDVKLMEAPTSDVLKLYQTNIWPSNSEFVARYDGRNNMSAKTDFGNILDKIGVSLVEANNSKYRVPCDIIKTAETLAEFRMMPPEMVAGILKTIMCEECDIVILLTSWAEGNKEHLSDMNVDSLKRLVGTIRFQQLSRTYLTIIYPVIANHYKLPSEEPWLPGYFALRAAKKAVAIDDNFKSKSRVKQPTTLKWAVKRTEDDAVHQAGDAFTILFADKPSAMLHGIFWEMKLQICAVNPNEASLMLTASLSEEFNAIPGTCFRYICTSVTMNMSIDDVEREAETDIITTTAPLEYEVPINDGWKTMSGTLKVVGL